MYKMIVMLIALMFPSGQGLFAKSTFMPDNNLYKEDPMFTGKWDGKTNVTEQTFNEVINKAMSIYGPIASRMGVRLVINPKWSDPTVNAQAYQEGNTWYIDMFGGLARRREVTVEGFVMVVCHEMGHHFGGYPLYPREWAALEGQSDYFSANVCAKKMFANDTTYIKYLSRVAVDKCKKLYTGQNLNVCYHVMSGSKSCGDLLAALNGERVAFETPSNEMPASTDIDYPSAQCRLDTMATGALCTVPWNDSGIPRDAGSASSVNCMSGVGARPRCWFVR